MLTPTRIALQIAEQIVGIPVLRGCGEQRLQGLLPRQGSTLVSSAERISERTVEQLVDISSGGLQGFSPGQGSTVVCGAEHANIPVPLGRGGLGDGGLHGLSQGQGSTAFCEAEHVDISVPHGRGGSQGQGSTAVCGAEHVDIPVPHGRGKLGDGVFSASSAGAADDGPAVRGSGMGKARFAGEVASRALSSRGKAGFAGEDALVLLLLAARLVLLVTMPLVCLLELSLVLAVKGLAQDRVQQRFVDAGLLDRSSWSLTLPGVRASSTLRQRRPCWLTGTTSGSPRPTWGAFSQVTTSRSPSGSCPLVGGKRSTWRSCKG